MGLRGRFTWWFALAALVPIALAAIVTRQVVSSSFRADYRQVRESAEAAAREELASISLGVAATVEALASRAHPDVRGLLFELQVAGGPLPPESRLRLRERDAGIMAGVGLDLMFLISDDQTILAAPHFRATVDELDREYRERAVARRGQAYFALEPMLTGGETREALVAEAARIVQEGGRSITVVGGRELPVSMVERLRRDRRVDARLVAADGSVLVPFAGDGAASGAPIRVALPGPDGAALAALELVISDAELQHLRSQVTLAAALLAAAALLVTALLGFGVARGMTRDLDVLVTGVQAAARGELEHRVPVRRRDEIGAVAAAVNDMMGGLEEANARLAVAQRVAAWQEIARRLAHEIKNPLTPIQISVETMRRTRARAHPSFDEVFEESTATILEEVGRLKRIVSEFSEFARLPKPALARCDLDELVVAQVALYRGSAGFSDQLAGDLPPVRADRDQLAQVLLNLIENARDAVAPLGDQGRVCVQTRAWPDRAGVTLSVSDNGPGVPPELRSELFTPYFTTKHAAGGTGLGLAIAHRIVSDHGGQLVLGDAKGGGARFEVRLPAADPLAAS